MMSISPQVGQPTLEMLSPSIQNAGHTEFAPVPELPATLMHACICPYSQLVPPVVESLVEISEES